MSFIQESNEDDDCPAENEVPLILSIFLAAYFHIGSIKYRADGAQGGLFFSGLYRLDIVPYDLVPEIPLDQKRERIDWALIRLSSRCPFFNRSDVQFAIASLPGIEHVYENNLLKGIPRHPIWKRASDSDQIAFGFEASLDLRKRATLYWEFRARFHKGDEYDDLDCLEDE
ncbi:MAG TPA: hypothetical protein VGL56_14975 [Fimbriimonadaceae bacterium]|jgi:hypothetical protein